MDTPLCIPHTHKNLCNLNIFFLIFYYLNALYTSNTNNIEYFENQIIHKNLFNFYIHILSYPKNIINEHLILSITEDPISNVEY